MKHIQEKYIVSLRNALIRIENKVYDAYYTPIIFDGYKLEHFNTDDLVGNKYSLVFFKIKN